MKRYGWTKITIADIIQMSKLADMINVDEKYLNMSVGQCEVLSINILKKTLQNMPKY